MKLAEIDILILAGGLGTRLQGVLPQTPKILAPVLGQPFLEHLLTWFEAQGARRIILGLGFRAADVIHWLATRPPSRLDIETVVESEPLGTGGAVALAYPLLKSNPAMVVNGDTVVGASLNSFLASHVAAGAGASILTVRVDQAGRYGRLEIDANHRVVRFEEKDPHASGSSWINAGFYLFERTLLDRIHHTLEKGSLERDVLEQLPEGSIHAHQSTGRFLDIGTPETLAMAAEVFTA